MNKIILLDAFAQSVATRYDKSDATIEIVVMLFIAALLGFLLRQFMGHRKKTEIIHADGSSENSAQNKKLQAEIDSLKAELEQCKKGNSSLKSAAITTDTGSSNTSKSNFKSTEKPPSKTTTKKTKTTKATKTTKSTGKKDDLKVVEGIGPAIEKLLNSGGISSYSDLASAKVSDLEKILDDAGPRFRVHVPTTWPEQAALLRDGKMDQFEKLTEELKGGRRK